MKMFETDTWANGYAQGTVYSFLWGKVEFEYERRHERNRFCCLVSRWLGGHIYQMRLYLFGRTITLSIWPLS